MPSIDDLVHELRPAAAGAEPHGALVVLHGRATGEHDVAPLFDELDPGGRLVAVAPRGPLSLPPGGAHWYAPRGVGYPDPETFLSTLERLGGWLDALPDAIGVPAERTVVAGFSQGAAMTYAVGLGEGRPPPAGLIALSGFIPTVAGFALDLDSLPAGYPVAIGHGRFDPVIEVALGQSARDRLSEAGADVLWRESPVGHTIDASVLPDLADFVGRVLGG